MPRFAIILAATMVTAGAAHAQQAPYTATVDTATYQPLTSGTAATFSPIGSLPAGIEGVATISLPFTFNFFGENYDTLYAFTNGVVAFAPLQRSVSTVRQPGAVPQANDILDAYIAPFWTGLEQGSGTLRHQTVGPPGLREFTVEYFEFDSRGFPVTFSVELRESDFSIRMHYQTVSGANPFTAAIEGERGGDGLLLFGCTPSNCLPNVDVRAGDRVTVRLPDAPDLIGTVLGPPGGAPGDTVDVDVIVENAGLQPTTGAADWELYISLDPDSVAGADLLASGSVGVIASTSSVTLARSVTLPGTLTVGQYFLVLRTDVAGDVAEAREDNNDFALPFGTGPDLVGTSVAVPGQLGPGTTFDYTFSIRSQGVAVTEPVGMEFRLIQLDGPSLGIRLDRQNISVPNGGLGGEVTVELTIPVGVMTGVIRAIGVDIDYDRLVTELDETNNFFQSDIVQMRNADLRFGGTPSSGPAFEGAAFDLSVPLNNGGPAYASRFDICVDIDDRRILTVSDVDLPQSASTRLELRPVMPVASAGFRRISIILDCFDVIPEDDENNTFVGEVFVFERGADLIPRIVSQPSVADAGEALPLRLGVRNRGVEDARPEIEVRLAPRVGDDAFTTTLDDFSFVDPNTENTRSVMLTLPNELASGRYDLSITSRAVAGTDVDETNNVALGGTIDVSGFGVAVVDRDPPAAVLQQPYRFTFGVAGGTNRSWSLEWTEAAPDGITFSAGTFAGQPTAVGTHPFTAEVTADEGAVAFEGVLEVFPPGLPLTIVDRALPPTVEDESYRERITILGGAPPYTVTAPVLPFGFSLLPDGTLFGSCNRADAFMLQISVVDSRGGSASAPVAFDCLSATESIFINLPALPDALVDRPYEARATVSGGSPPYFYALEGELPPGLAFDAARGTFSGTPTAAGDFPLFVTARDSVGLFDRNPFVLRVIEAGNLRIVSRNDALPDARVGEAYINPRDRMPVQIEVEGASEGRPVMWSVAEAGGLPPGLSLDPARGVLSGTPTEAGVFSFTVVASDMSGDVARRFLAIRVLGEGETTFIERPDEGCASVPANGLMLAAGLLSFLRLRRSRRARADEGRNDFDRERREDE